MQVQDSASRTRKGCSVTHPDTVGFAHSRFSPRTVDAAVETVALAFGTDPTWSPIVESPTNRPDTATRYWSVFVRSAQRFPWSAALMASDVESSPAAEATGFSANTSTTAAAVSVWLPPGADELTAEESEQLPRLAREIFGEERTQLLLDTSARFEAAYPSGDFFYLSLLATHPSYRGHGYGMRLLADNLRELDRLGMPSYLESSNPVNDARYRALGYEQHGTITLPSGLEISTFWRDPHPA